LGIFSLYPLLGSSRGSWSHQRRSFHRDIARKAVSARSAEDLFFELALVDLTRAAELFRRVFAQADRVDGWMVPRTAGHQGSNTRRCSGQRHVRLL